MSALVAEPRQALQARLPWTMRAFNVAAAPVSRQVRLDPERLIGVARRRTGLEDLGDPAVEVALRALVEAYEATANLSPLGRVVVRGQLVQHLCARLELVAFVQRFRGVEELRIERPIVVVGLPRSGTTWLHDLLSQLPGARAPSLWEMSAPAPPRSGPDRRLERAVSEVRWFTRMAPGFAAAHPLDVEAPEECAVLFRLGFTTEMFQAFGRVPSYLDWLDGVDRSAAYRWYHRGLQVLHAQRPGRWVLKHPGALGSLDALRAVLPDARIVHIHRDPVPAAASYCSLMAVVQALTAERVDHAHLGDDWLRTWAPAAERAASGWDRLGGEVAEVAYADLVRDPVGTVAGILEAFDEPLDAGTRERIRAAIAARPADRHGRHRYALEDFGLVAGEIRERLAPWTRRFGG